MLEGLHPNSPPETAPEFTKKSQTLGMCAPPQPNPTSSFWFIPAQAKRSDSETWKLIVALEEMQILSERTEETAEAQEEEQAPWSRISQRMGAQRGQFKRASKLSGILEYWSSMGQGGTPCRSFKEFQLWEEAKIRGRATTKVNSIRCFHSKSIFVLEDDEQSE
jgi:hypothetical protein